ncbi:MAG: hypothetical protein ACI94Y_004264 [Maribacter sp.]|jgi:hypothetical protein
MISLNMRKKSKGKYIKQSRNSIVFWRNQIALVI